MDPYFPRQKRSIRTISYRFGRPGCPEHTYYLLSRLLANIQGGLHLELDDETRALARVKGLITAAYLLAQSSCREPDVIMATEFARVQGPINEDILQFLLLEEPVQSVAHHGANRERDAQIHLQENDPSNEKLKEQVSNIIQIMEFLGLFGRRTISFEDLRIIVDSIFPQAYNADNWDDFHQSGHLITVTGGSRKKRVVLRHSANGFFLLFNRKVVSINYSLSYLFRYCKD